MPRTLHRFLTLAAVAAMTAFIGCDEGGFAEPDPEVPAGEENPNPPTVPKGNAPARVTLLSGGGQEGKTFEPLTEPFVVEVTDDRGIRVEGATVRWAVVKGTGNIQETSGTDVAGRTYVTYTAGHLGGDVIEASVDGVVSPARFAVTTTTQVLRIYGGKFYANQASDPGSVTVPVGTRLEIENRDVGSQHVIRTVSAPPASGTLMSKPLAYMERYAFVPTAAGTWEYECALHPEHGIAELVVKP